MRLLFLPGAPAAGKLTIAKALRATIPGRLFDNHAAINLALTLFEFGAPGFWELVHGVRYSAIDAAAGHGVPLVVTTFCYAEPDDLPQFEKVEQIVQRRGGELLPVFLHCSREERVGNPDRIERRKLTSREILNADLDRYQFSPVPRPDCLTLDTEARPADASAREIINHFGLGGSKSDHSNIDVTDSAPSRSSGRNRSIISPVETRSTCAPMLIAAMMAPS
jgi:hypothetical protein